MRPTLARCKPSDDDDPRNIKAAEMLDQLAIDAASLTPAGLHLSTRRVCSDNRNQLNLLEERTKNIAGYDVRVVSRARLREISLCKNGAAGENAFAFLVDTTLTPKPVAGSRSKKFHDYNAMYKVSRKVREIKATTTAMLALQERLALLGSEHEPIDWSMSRAIRCNRRTLNRCNMHAALAS
jgi:hypothetical protein